VVFDNAIGMRFVGDAQRERRMRGNEEELTREREGNDTSEKRRIANVRVSETAQRESERERDISGQG